MVIHEMSKTNNYVAGEKGECLNYPNECWTCVYFRLYGQFNCSRPNQKVTYTTVHFYGDDSE